MGISVNVSFANYIFLRDVDSNSFFILREICLCFGKIMESLQNILQALNKLCIPSKFDFVIFLVN